MGENSTKQRYKFHKDIVAVQITGITQQDDNNFFIHPCDASLGLLPVNKEYIQEFNPQSGGYYLEYPTGYKSYSDNNKTSVDRIAELREKQVNIGYDTAHDFQFNEAYQLISAAIQLVEVDQDDEDPEGRTNGAEIPIGWDKERFRKLMMKPYKERVLIAASFLAAEYDMIEFDEDLANR